MGRPDPKGLTLDTGALLAFEAGDRRVSVLLQRAKDLGRPIVIPAGVLAQAWSGPGPRRARLAMLLKGPLVRVEDLTRDRARTAGELCGRARTSDVVDASVVVAAWSNGHLVVTSDAADIRRLDPAVEIVAV